MLFGSILNTLYQINNFGLFLFKYVEKVKNSLLFIFLYFLYFLAVRFRTQNQQNNLWYCITDKPFIPLRGKFTCNLVNYYTLWCIDINFCDAVDEWASTTNYWSTLCKLQERRNLFYNSTDSSFLNTVSFCNNT
jgi:hypothetical protein